MVAWLRFQFFTSISLWAMFQSPQMTNSRPQRRMASRRARKRSMNEYLRVDIGDAQPLGHLVGRAPGVDRDPAVAALLGRMEVAVQPARGAQRRHQVTSLALISCRHAHVGLLPQHPLGGNPCRGPRGCR